ncbi:hypothetical protein sscle_14g101240 [Sclerotinia sclerotiorum 1980 UF-70]|uniref:Uncharacterized protein n=1 Tax=Sclerotinia sclerotiorum (strain ATCC 18683 / 1980 / Ss-1) TaxID=665079 RepID=A0A1D9QK91_SCLS1|nr:hypothetical protein sscle_14g101240 [Sclerotinia sclerotiorum 1980 UF-70]
MLMSQKRYKKEQRWSWEADVPSTNLNGASIGSRSRGSRLKDSMASESKVMTGKEEPMESSTSNMMPPIQANVEIRASRRLEIGHNLHSYMMQEYSGRSMKRWRADSENESDATAKQRRTKLDNELEPNRLRNKRC